MLIIVTKTSSKFFTTMHGFRRKVLNKSEFAVSRKKLGKTQKQLAELLGMALKTVHSYEQGWRKIPPHIERQMFFLLCKQRTRHKTLTPCWEKKQCDLKLECPAWEFQSGHLCWFLSGTKCEEVEGLTSEEKTEKCRNCDILASLLAE
jgi:DNA-binding XRE family transcriptional regulator